MPQFDEGFPPGGKTLSFTAIILCRAAANKLGAMLIYSISVSVDGFIADREGAFRWTVPSEELFRFHMSQVRELGSYLLGRNGRVTEAREGQT